MSLIRGNHNNWNLVLAGNVSLGSQKEISEKYCAARYNFFIKFIFLLVIMRTLIMNHCWWITSITFHLVTHKIQYNIIVAMLCSLTFNFAVVQCYINYYGGRAQPGNGSPPCVYRTSYLLQESSFSSLNITTWIINKSTGISYRLVSSPPLEEHFQINPLLFFLNPRTIKKFLFVIC